MPAATTMPPRLGDDQNKPAVTGMALASLILGSGLAGLAVGYGIDHWLDSSPKGLLICFFLFLAAGFTTMIREARK